jgi:hypothetical protein
MKEKTRYTVRQYILLLVASATTGLVISAIVLSITARMLGFGSQGVLVIILFSLPVCIFSVLYGFYKGLVKHYGFEGEEKLFFGGKF